jgi:DNA-binding transcriptional regulator YbjK
MGPSKNDRITSDYPPSVTRASVAKTATEEGSAQSSVAARRGRTPQQERSAQRQKLIADAAISVIARNGLAGVTHRRVADYAGVSLAATTYYYKTKADIIAVASDRLLESYVEAFSRFAARHRDAAAISFRDFVTKVVINFTSKHRLHTIAWCEIILDGARHPETRSLARTWFARLFEVWGEMARVLAAGEPATVARSAIDTVIGLIFVIIPLGLSESQVMEVLQNGGDPNEIFRPQAAEDPNTDATQTPARSARKAEKTRAGILAAAIGLMIAEGAAGVTYRAISKRAGVSPTAPIYYYPSIESLLQAAQVQLFENSKDRYRAVMSGVDRSSIDIDRLADLTATVFVREATEFGAVSLADFPVRLAAARHPALRATVWGVIEYQNRAWSRVLGPLSDRPRALDALLVQSLFAGKLVRLLAIDATTLDLSAVRAEFRHDLQALARGRHWTSGTKKVVRKIKNR